MLSNQKPNLLSLFHKKRRYWSIFLIACQIVKSRADIDYITPMLFYKQTSHIIQYSRINFIQRKVGLGLGLMGVGYASASLLQNQLCQYIKEMWGKLLSRLGSRYLFKSTNIFYHSMEANKDIKTIDYTVDQFGDYPFIRSTFQSGRKWIAIPQVDDSFQGQEVLVRARVHNVRGKGNNCFIVLRENFYTLQACAFKSQTISKEMIKYMAGVPNQSIVDIVGKVCKPEKAIESCTQQVQLQIVKFFVVNRATNRLPLQIADASRKVQHNQFDPDQQNEVQKKEEVKVETKVETKVEEQPQPKVQQAPTTTTEVVAEGTTQNATVAVEGKAEKKPKKEKKKKEEKVKQVKEEVKQSDVAPIVKMKTRLDNRVIDLRTTAKQAIFKLSSGVCQLFREYCLNNDFVEIHTPKLIGGTSEGGSNVFSFNYFHRKACLAQSPQLYKQMCVMGDFQRVFEIGPVFRAQNSFTHRHMCEFVGLDIQMAIKEHYYELLDFFGELFPFIFNHLEQRYARQLKAINEQFEFTPFKCKLPIVKLTFAEGIQLLKENGVEWPQMEDLSTQVEKKLGEFVKNKYDTDFYILHRYPVSARPFYTMLCHDDPNYTCSYDMFMRGEEILSGAQRIHDPEILKQRAIAKGIDPSTISDYIESFQYGAYPHGGGGIGLERVVMLYCALKNIRNSSLFPRDPKRITP